MKRNLYYRKRLHKRKMMKYFEFQWDKSRRSWKEILERYDDDPQYPIRYWQRHDMGGRKMRARQETNRRIRQRYRVKVLKKELEDIKAPRNADYRKSFDYWWEID